MKQNELLAHIEKIISDKMKIPTNKYIENQQNYCLKSQSLVNSRINDNEHRINSFIDRYEDKMKDIADTLSSVKKGVDSLIVQTNKKLKDIELKKAKVSFYFIAAGAITGVIINLIPFLIKYFQ